MRIVRSQGIFGGAAKRVFIAVPSGNGISASTSCSLFGAKEALLHNGIESELEIFDGNCHVDDARNTLARDFLESECTDMVFIDTDVRFTPEDLVKLVLHDQDVVAGIYPLKQDDENYPVEFIQGEIWANEFGLIEVEGVPTGFLKMRRTVIEQLYKNAIKFTAKQDTTSRMQTPVIFERRISNNVRLGGDYEFCRKWKSIGGKIYIDPEMTFGHNGLSEWSGRVGDFLRNKAGLKTEYIKTLLENIKNHKDVECNILRLYETWGNNWALQPEQLQVMYEIAKERDGAVLECGCGLSTLILGALGKRVTAFENDKSWFDKVNDILISAGIDSVELHNVSFKDGWYDTTAYKGDDLFNLILCDGPPRTIGREGLPLFIKDKITDNCTIIIDDYEKGVLSTRLEELGFSITPMGTQKNYAVGIIKQ